MLSRIQAREYNRFKKLEDFLKAETEVYASFAPFAGEVTAFTDNLQNLEKLIPAKAESTLGITTDKTLLKRELSSATALVCLKTRAYALRFQQPELAAQMDTSATRIFKMKDADVMGYTTSVVNLLTPMLPDAAYIPYGITATSLDAITVMATHFNNLIGVVRQTETNSTVANTEIDKVIALLHIHIKHLDLLIGEFESTHHGFVQGYHINSSADNVGIRHSGIQGMVRDGGGQPIVNATIQLEGTDKKTVTNLAGIYHLNRVATADYIVQVSATGYTSQQVAHHISRGKMDELNFQLDA